MSETVYTSGSWTPNPGSEDAFVEAWTQFAEWATGFAGAGTLHLTRDLREPSRFLSFGNWESVDAARAWTGSPDFREHLAQVLQHVGDFHSSEYQQLVTATSGGRS